MRSLLQVGAIPQGGSSAEKIGPFPNLAAIRAELECGAANYCVATPNADFALGARMTSTGRPSLSVGGLTVGVEGATVNQFGLFLVGGAETRTPVGGGTLCVGAGAAGFYRLQPPTTVGPAGSAERAFDTSELFLSTIVPGDVLHFQFWYRDPEGPHALQSNVSDARALRFCP